MSYLVDTHAHLDMIPPEGLDSVMEAADEAGVSQVITIGIDLESSRKAVRLSGKYDNVFAAVGVHPHDASGCDNETLEMLEGLAGNGRVVAWGEIGLDYAKKYSPVDVQQDVFRRQLEIALELDMPVIIHDREAHEDTLTLLAPFFSKGLRGVFHCYSGDVEMAGKVLDMGFYISVTGVVTFRNAAGLRDVVRYVPLERMMVETDAPFLSPVPFRGKRNEPARVVMVAEKIAELKSVSAGEVAECTSRNARELFGLPLP